MQHTRITQGQGLAVMNIRPVNRLMLISIAGACEAMLQPWFDRNDLPNLASIWSGSLRGTLRSSQPPNASAAWASMMTGRSTPHHGVYDPEFVQSNGKYISQTDCNRIQAPHLWQILGQAGHSVISIHAPLSYGMSADRTQIISPADMPLKKSAVESETMIPKKLAAGWSQHSLWNRRPKSHEEAVNVTSRHQLHHSALANVADWAGNQREWSLLHVHFQDLDGLQHHMWPELEIDQSSTEARPEWVPLVRDTLRSLDTAVGRLAELADKQNAALMIVSDHGFGPCRSLVNVNGILRIHGIQRRQSLSGSMIHRSQSILRTIADRNSPALKGYAKARPMDSRHSCDWSSSLAFAPFGQHSGLIYLTDKARRHEGRAERATHEVAEIFRLIAEPESGESVFSDVIPVATRWGIDPVSTGWPDIIAIPTDGFEPVAHWNHKEKVRLFRTDPNQPGTHYADGVVSMKAQGLDPGRTTRDQIQDIAPTILRWLNLPVPESMDGRIIGSNMEPSIYQPHIRPNSGRKVIVNARQTASFQFPVS